MGMRYPVEQKAETHEKILKTAARAFLERGSENNGIGRVMEEVGLTKGGFYRHFKSKDDLYAAAVGRAFEQLGDWMSAAAAEAPEGQKLRAIIERYLSAEHVAHPENGCPLAMLGAEMARQPVKIRKRIFQSMLGFRERMLPYVPGRTPEEKLGRFFVLFPGMAGVLSAARAIPEPEGRERMLSAARAFYLAAFAQEAR